MLPKSKKIYIIVGYTIFDALCGCISVVCHLNTVTTAVYRGDITIKDDLISEGGGGGVHDLPNFLEKINQSKWRT